MIINAVALKLTQASIYTISALTATHFLTFIPAWIYRLTLKELEDIIGCLTTEFILFFPSCLSSQHQVPCIIQFRGTLVAQLKYHLLFLRLDEFTRLVPKCQSKCCAFFSWLWTPTFHQEVVGCFRLFFVSIWFYLSKIQPFITILTSVFFRVKQAQWVDWKLVKS